MGCRPVIPARFPAVKGGASENGDRGVLLDVVACLGKISRPVEVRRDLRGHVILSKRKHPTVTMPNCGSPPTTTLPVSVNRAYPVS